MKVSSLAALLLAGCTHLSPVERWGRDVCASSDYPRRTDLVGRIVDSGDPNSIPVLVDCLAAAIKYDKLKPREGGDVVKPWTVGPELWGLIVLTHQDFDRDCAAWRAWWDKNRDALVWDPAGRCFKPK